MQPYSDAPRWKWNKQRVEVAVLLAEGDLTDNAIAQRAGISVDTLHLWQRYQPFASRVQRLIDRMTEEAEDHAIARRYARIAQMQGNLDRINALIAARAEEYADIPGGSTGLLVKQTKANGRQIVVEYAADIALLREQRELMKQAAQDLGQWTEKREVTGANGGPLEIADARERIAARLAALAGEDDGEGEEPE